MFYDAPRFRLPPFKLGLAPAHDLRLRGRQGVVGVNDALRLHEHTPLFCANATKSPSRMLRFSKISRGMTTCRRWPTRPMRSFGGVTVLLAISSEYLSVRNCQAYHFPGLYADRVLLVFLGRAKSSAMRCRNSRSFT